MTTIDQRILIPVPQDTVWNYINDIQNNPNWQADCHSVTYLNSLRSGPGIRWRYSSHSGHDYVLETTAWYDGLGYEYTYVDGMPFQESRGRLRLQEIPEGTIVQWTLSYEMRGIVGGFRNAIGMRRQLENMMVTSLKTLWQVMKQARTTGENYESKSLMRDALDYEARAQYRSRHTPPPAEAIQPVTIEEPPISDEDTRPRPAITEAPATSEPEPAAEPIKPDLIEKIPDEPVPEPAKLDAAEKTSDEIAPSPTAEPAVREEPESAQPAEATQPQPDQAAASSAETPADKPTPAAPEAPPVIVEPEKPPAASKTSSPAAPSSEPPIILDTPEEAPVDEPDQPTAAQPVPPEGSYDPEASIWDIFGVPRPSETQEMRAVQSTEESSPAPIPAQEEEPAPATDPDTTSQNVPSKIVVAVTAGWRLRHRRQTVKLRYRKTKSAQPDA